MSRQVIWTDTILDEYMREAVLSEFEIDVLKAHVRGVGRVEMAIRFNCSVSTIDRIIARLKRKYDVAALYNPLLPVRKKKDA